MPYRGIDQWIRLVIPLGGTVLTVVAALTAFWPRRARTGFPIAALIMLVTLYAIPAVALDFQAEFLRGALLALLMLAFLRLERLRLTRGRRGRRARGRGGGRGADRRARARRRLPVVGLRDVGARHRRPKSTSFSWDHSYGPLNWPRDGREMLRVKAKQAAYWKAQSLDIFDGVHWRASQTGTHESSAFELPSRPDVVRRFTQTIKVNIRNLRTRTFITAGIPTGAPQMPNRAAIPNAPPGIWLSSRTLHRGDTYTVSVYTPDPSEQRAARGGRLLRPRLQRLPHHRPREQERLAARRRARRPGPARGALPRVGVRGIPPNVVRRSVNAGAPIEHVDGQKALASSELKRTWALSQRLRRNAKARSTTSTRSSPTWPARTSATPRCRR